MTFTPEELIAATRKAAEHFLAAGYPTQALYVLRNENTGKREEFTREEKKIIARLLKRSGGFSFVKQNQCYFTCQKFINRDYETLFRYHEGYILIAPFIEIPHAWLTLNGKIYDPTELRNQKEKKDFEPWVHLGIELDREMIWKAQLESQVYGPVIECKAMRDIFRAFREDAKPKERHKDFLLDAPLQAAL